MAAGQGPSLRATSQADQEQFRNHRVSLLSLHPSPAPSTRSPSPEARQRSSAQASHVYEDEDDDAYDEILDPPTLRSYRKALRYHLLALTPALGLILILIWVSSSYADLSRDHRHHKGGSRPSQKPALILGLLGAAAWLAGYAIRPLVWDLVDNVLRIVLLPFSWISQRWARRASKREYQQASFGAHAEHDQDGGATSHVPPSSPLRTALVLAFSILLRTVVLELLRVGSMAVCIAVVQAATRKGHIWLQEAQEADFRGRALRLSPYDVRFGAVLWTTVGWCAAEWLVGSYDVIRKLGLYHPALWPQAIYSPSAYQDEQDEDRSDTADAASSQDEDEDTNMIDQEAAFPRSRTQNSRLTKFNEAGPGPGSSGIEAATSAAQAAVHAVRFFPRVFTQASTKSSSSSAFTVRQPGQGGAGTSGFGLHPAGGTPQSVTRRRTVVSNSTGENAQQSLLTPAGAAQHEQAGTEADNESRMYGTFQTARTSPPTVHLHGELGNRFESPPPAAYAVGDDAAPHVRDFAYDGPATMDSEEEAALQADLAHALAILLAARERADLEDTLGGRLDTQVGPALAALWRIDGFVWNLGECLIAAAAVALTSAGPPDEDWEYETFPGLTESPLWLTWLILTMIHTLLSLLWATALPRWGFAPVSYSSLLLGLLLTVAGLAWWGVLI